MSASLKTWPLPGGVHPPENKAQSLTTGITQTPIPAQIVLPLSMHIGSPAEPIVNVGDSVLKGQMIAKSTGFVSAPVHASTSGIIKAIEPRAIIHASGLQAPCIVIDTDGEDTWCEHTCIENYQSMEKSDLLDHIRNAGIAGMGGAGFPSAVKLATDKTIDTLIINGTECEPYITADDILMREKASDIVQGIQILQHLVSPQKTLIGIEDNKPEAIKALRQATAKSNISVVVFPTKYPSGGEKQLIRILTGKEVKAGTLPADNGIVCQNAGTAEAIYKAVVLGQPLVSRITTVTGNAVREQKNYEVLLGTSVRELLKLSGFDKNKSERIISGGPMMGFAINAIDVPVVKTTNCILAPDRKELPAPPPAQACIRCGICAEACPVHLLPQQMYWFSQSKDHDGLKKHHLMDCIECGACSYVCPSNIPLVQYFRASKSDIRQTAVDHKKADYTKLRFEARQARLDKIEADKEAKRLARQKKAASKPAASNKDKDAIQAALARTGKTAPVPPPKPAPAAPQGNDPVAAAIARAKAKASTDTPEPTAQEKAQDNIAALEKRLAKAEDKLKLAQTNNDEHLSAFEASVDKLKAKLKTAKAALPEKSVPTAPPRQEAIDDPVAAAIARAKSKRGGTEENLSEAQQLQQSIDKLAKRIIAIQTKYDAAVASNDDNAGVIKSSLEKLQAKKQQAENDLSNLSAPTEVADDPTPAITPDSDTIDPVQAAIARAKSKRQSAQALSPKERLEKDIAAFKKRIQSTEEKLQLAKDQNDDKVAILEDALAKLNDKLTQAQTELEGL